AKASLEEATTSSGKTPLSLSAERGHASVVDELLARRARVDQPNLDGSTALMCAAHQCEAGVVSLLLSRNALVNNADTEGWSALMYAMNAPASAYHSLSGNERGEKMVGIEGVIGRKSTLDLLVLHKADVNAQSADGLSPLLIVSSHDRPLAVKQLLDCRAQVNMATMKGQTPILMAAASDLPAVVKTLIIASGDPNQANAKGDCPLSVSEKQGFKVGKPDPVTGIWEPEDVVGRLDNGLNECMASAIQELLQEKQAASIGDYGAGSRCYSEFWKSEGLDVKCYDGNPAIKSASHGLCEQLDISVPEEDLPQVDFAVSLEVAEHIPKPREAAYFGQDGDGHVSTQTQEYFIATVTAMGYKLDAASTDKLRKGATRNGQKPHAWNSQNFMEHLLVFKRVLAMLEGALLADVKADEPAGAGDLCGHSSMFIQNRLRHRYLVLQCDAESKRSLKTSCVVGWIPQIWQQQPSDDELYAAALRRPSFLDSDLESEPARRYMLEVDHQKLLRIAGSGRRLVVTWTTGGPKRWSIAHNLALSIRRNAPELEPIFVVVALDREAVTRAEAAGFHAVLNERSVDVEDDIWKMRWLIQVTCISIGIEVLVVDSDIVFLSDPFELFHFDADIEAMTDHFFPAEQLWATWLRPAEHINTGFIFARPSPELLEFLVEFIDLHYHAYEGPIPRDGMDQRVFNKFVMDKLERSPPEAISVYENLTFPGLDWQKAPTRFLPSDAWVVEPGRSGRPVVVRLLDPVCISHGMNYFWRKAYKFSSCGGIQGRLPAIVHVNGVDPKMYFLRDRNLWYLDDWDERFGNSTAFLVYEHPKGLSLADDFEVLIAALEMAAYLSRRVVLPSTMNCANCPAYEVYRLNESHADEPGCTYDYFAHANGLYEVYSRTKPYAVEAGVGREPRFLELLASSSSELPPMAEMQQSGSLREEVLAIQQSPGRAAFAEFRVLHLSEDVRLLRDGLRSGAFGMRMNAERVFSCAHQEPLIGAMACLDEPYVEEFGEDAACPAQHFQEGCGPVGICCCWPFWGWGEKLQYFTGVPWDLPCNCGVSVCDRYERPLEGNNKNSNNKKNDNNNTSKGSGASEECCRHAGSDALFPTTDPGVFYCKTESSWSGITGAEDSNTYSSPALRDFAANKRSAAQTFETCRLDRMLRRGDAFREASLRECNLQVSAYLLERSRWEQLRKWSDWQLMERRGLSNSSLLIAGLEGNLTTDNTGFSGGKLAHDLEQLELLAEKELVDGEAADYLEQALPVFRRLSQLFAEHQSGRAAAEDVQQMFVHVRPFFNRALHVPNFAMPASASQSLFRGDLDFAGAESALRQNGFAVLDDVLLPETLGVARSWLSESTVWYQSLLEGEVLKAQVRDGLNADIGLGIARELKERRMPGLVGGQPLLDLLAYKHGPSSRGLPPHCVDGVVAALLWVVDPGGAEFSQGGLRFFAPEDSDAFCGDDRVGPAPAKTLEDFSAKQTRVAAPSEAGEALHSVPYRSNRLVLWRASSHCVELEHDGAAWRSGFPFRRVDLLMLFGHHRVAAKETGSGFVAGFEGKADEWGGHYYARDHDHR
ncbi:unnamed protein product, partial [Polarella glacialis]